MAVQHVLQIQLQRGHVGVVVQHAQAHQAADHALGIPLRHADEQVGHRLHGPLVQAAHDAEVDNAQPAVLQHEQIARVRVAVEDAFNEHLAQKHFRAQPGQLRRVDAQRAQPLENR